MAKKGFAGEYTIYVKIALGIILVMIGWPLVSGIIKSIKNGLNLNSAVDNAKVNADKLNPPAGSSAARALKIQGWADTLHSLFASFVNKSTSVVEVLNATLNAEEVVALSDYYNSTYAKSLLAEVNSELGSSANFFGKGWKDLKPYVQNNLI